MRPAHLGPLQPRPAEPSLRDFAAGASSQAGSIGLVQPHLHS